MRTVIRGIGLVLLAICSLAVVPRAQEITLTAADGAQLEFPVEGKPCRVASFGDAVALRVTYRPNSKTIEAVTLTPTAAGDFEWTPKAAGLAMLELVPSEAEDAKAIAKKTVSVRFDGLSVVGLFVMIFAALFLFGGAFISIRALLRDGNPSD